MEKADNYVGQTVEVTILFFAKSRELVEKSTARVNVCANTTGERLIQEITNSFPSLSVIKDSVVVAVNQDYIDRNSFVQLQGREEIAVIPPISGG